jgi:hypothetical protein
MERTKQALVAWSFNAALCLIAAALSGSFFLTALCAISAYAAGRCKSDLQPNKK